MSVDAAAGRHSLSLTERTEVFAMVTEVTFTPSCSCGWEGAEFSTDLRVISAFWSSDSALCKTAAVEQGDEHLASQS